jgi:hypothetical protein
MLKKILLPSGGQMEVSYETDDYAFVQNKRAAVMMNVVGFGSNTSTLTNQLYQVNGSSFTEHNYAFIKVPTACSNASDVYKKYLEGIQQLSFKLAVNMPKGMEFLNSYATIEGNNYGVYSGDATGKTIWVKLNNVDGLSPLSLTAVEFLREQLPGQAFPGYDVSESTGLAQVGNMLAGLFNGLKDAFKSPVKAIRQDGKAQTVELAKCFVRVNDPDGFKYGGGYRVKSVRLKDNWRAMNGGQLYTSEYGQDYDYTTTEVFNGAERKISSGVASYEPSLGGDENPFQTMVQLSNKVPLGPTSYGSVEMPVLDAFFPSASVGYSKVTVTSIKKGTQDTTKKTRSGIGKQVSEYYTAKDFPVYYSNTIFDPGTDKQGKSSTFAFFYKYAIDTRSLSQGFLVETNDMHGKMKSQSSYAENDDKAPINYTQNFYRNTGANGFNEKFDFVHASQGGTIIPGNMGIDVELMTDTREFAVKSNSLEIQGQLDLFPILFPFWLPFIWPVVGKSENIYRAVTTTKVVSYHSILDSVLVIDKGSVVSTKNLVFDAETGDVIVNRTNNDYKQAVYTTNYPAWWAYSGMGLAYKNIDATYTANFRDGVINIPTNIFESGDELYVINSGTPSTDACATNFNTTPAKVLWAFDKNKNVSSLTNTNPSFVFMDKDGLLQSRNNVRFRIIRSGKRNMLDAKAASIVGMLPPYTINNGIKTLNINASSKTITASAIEFKEKWQVDNDLFKKYKLVYPNANLIQNGDFEAGNTGFTTAYNYGTASPPFGYYSIGTNPSLWCGCSISHGDHTTGYGKMMMVDGATNPPGPIFRNVWGQIITVTPNTTYYFSGWIQNSGIGSNFNPTANLILKINNTGVGSQLYANAPAGTWKQWTATWNSGNATSASLSIVNAELSGQGNNFEMDDLYFGQSPSGANNCTAVEVADCNGYLEKNINPYRKGLLGTFRTNQSKVFYGTRGSATENNLSGTITTNLPNNGFLNNFTPYWNFNTSNNLIPDEANTKWVWNSQITKINSKGLELETKDALGIYTAAQYGYNKTMPVAIANNSRSSEMFAESFEDYSYRESINANVQFNECARRHIDLTKGANTFLSSDRTIAHSGKNVLVLNSFQNTSIPFSVKDNETDNFSLNPKVSIAGGTLNDVGINVTNATFSPQTSSYSNFQFPQSGQSYGGNSVYIYVQDSLFPANGGNIAIHGFELEYFYYVQIPQPGYYNFNLGNSTEFCSNEDSYFYATATINKESGEYVNVIGYSTTSNPYFGDSKSIFICSPGIYKVTVVAGESKNSFIPFPNNGGGMCTSYQFLIQSSLTTSNQNFTFENFASTNMQNGCTYTEPITATDSMINHTFSLTPGKKMLFSGWVKELCTQQAPCTTQTYTNSKVELDFGGAAATVTLNPSGTIIEGWQKVEGEFTVPLGATTASLRLVNTSSNLNFWDDIRIQPYNANVKSYVYDPVNLRLVAELDANNYAKFYEYDAEGTLIRNKVETKEGIKTVTETRSAKQKNITTLQ